MTKKLLIIIIVFILILAGGLYYLFVFKQPVQLTAVPTSPSNGFTPLNPNEPVVQQPSQPTNTGTSTSSASTGGNAPVTLPILRQITTTPVAGYMASSTASSTVIRYLDRGVGHIFQTTSITDQVTEISNTTLPTIYEGYWNKLGNALVMRYVTAGTDAVTNFYAKIMPVDMSTTTDANTTPYQTKGQFMSPDIEEVAVSPKGNQIFTLNDENGDGVGYISGFDESSKVKILDTPITDMNVEWPQANTVMLTTKGSAVSQGFLYSLNATNASFTKILGGIMGLSTRTSADLQKVLFSSATDQGMDLSVYNTKDGTTQDVIFKTLADKCVWSKLHTNEVYCAVPTQVPAGRYPDDWYKGTVSFVDQIWYLDTNTGEVHMLANPLTLAKQLVDAEDLTLDPSENYLYFINKNDLTLWSLDLNQSQ